MPGEKMLKAIESADSKKDGIDSQELHNALKELDKGEIARGLDHKMDKIKTVNGISDATRDLLTKIQSDPSNLKLSKDQIDGLHALHALLNPNEDGSTLNIKKLDKPEVINNVYFQNVKNAVEFEGSTYAFDGWEKGINNSFKVGSAQVLDLNNANTMYFVPFTLDGKLIIPQGENSINLVARGFDGTAKTGKDVVPKIAYIKDGKFTIENKDDYAKSVKNKEFVEKIETVSVDGLFLTKQLDKGVMKVAYLGDATILDIVSTGKYGLNKGQKEYEKGIGQFENISNGDERNQLIKEYNSAFVSNYKSYVKENTSTLMDNLSTDVFEVDVNSSLIDPVAATTLTVDKQKDIEKVGTHKVLDGGNIIVAIGKEGNAVSWNVYKKKDAGSYEVDKSKKQIDPNTSVVTAEKPKDAVENTDLMTKIDSLKKGFMFTGTGAIAESNKDGFLVHEKQALKKLAEGGTKNDNLAKIVDNLSKASGELPKSEAQKDLIKKVQTLIDPKLVADGFRGVKSHNSLLDFAGLSALKQTIASPAPVVEKNITTPIIEKKKTNIDVFATEKQNLAQLQENAHENIVPLLQKLVPSAKSMQEYIANLPKVYVDKLKLLDSTLKKDPKIMFTPDLDKGVFRDEYKKMLDNVKNLEQSLNRELIIKPNDYFNVIKYPYLNIIDAKLTSIVGTKLHIANDATSNIMEGYIKITSDPTNGNKYSWFKSNFFKNPIYEKGEKKFSIDQEVLTKSIQDRVKQGINTVRGASSPTQLV